MNPIKRSDSYKCSHYKMYPPDTSSMFSYFESRGGHYGKTVFFGLQYYLKEYMSQKITTENIDQAEKFIIKHGEPFNRLGWERIRNLGYFPIRIRAVPEGTLVPTHNALFTVQSTDPTIGDAATYWIASYLETQLERIWYPTTVSTQSWHIKQKIFGYLEKTSASPQSEIDFKLHDFGARGVSSGETAGIGGMSHLVNFKGSDTMEGVDFANDYYNCDMAGFSIPAAEHSTVTMWGRANERLAYRKIIEEYAKPGAMVAVVSDSYNLWHALENIWCDELRDEVIGSGATVVIRPDSGNPSDVVLRALQIMDRKLGCKKNLRGFKVLPQSFKLIQGDGINEDSIEEILHNITSHGYSASNVAFGMGGALLQKLDRDTQMCAYKCSYAVRNGEGVEVYKDPVDDPGKRSKSGLLDLVHDSSGFSTVLYNGTNPHGNSAMRTVFENGKILVDDTFEAVRKRANNG